MTAGTPVLRGKRGRERRVGDALARTPPTGGGRRQPDLSALLPLLAADTRTRCAAEIFRVLRPGGRALAIAAGPKRGMSALLSRQTPDPAYAGPIATLKEAGFTAVRQLAEADGVLYVEGIKRA